MRAFALVALCQVIAGTCIAETLTATCQSPKGVTIASGQKLATDSDGFGDGHFTYSWVVGESKASVLSLSGSGAGRTSMTESAAVQVMDKAAAVTFLVLYDAAIWTHTLFLDRREVFISRHAARSVGQEKVTLGSTFHAKCVIGLQ